MTVMVLPAEGKPGGDAGQSGLLSYFPCFLLPGDFILPQARHVPGDSQML